ncbi:F0F1 ATP synthase subunit A [Brevundimonas sp. BH3]|uniref:F0F1 ATP synthase subunit A n=1 Tax=Brevundimonas sp. BH3 TaxID=3133089 RepID=UPI00324FE48C
MAGPIEQFEVKPLVELGTVNVPVLGEQVIAITNSHVAMTLAFAAVVGFLTLATSKNSVVPGRMQAAGETMFGMVDGLTSSIIGHEGKKYFPFAFTIFMLVLGMNLLGMFLTFTATSQLAVTLTLGLISFLTVVIVGFVKNGLGFFKLFWPASAPLVLRPVVGIIEFVSFLMRPATLALRLFGNMLGGHVALKIFAQFCVSLGAAAIAGGGLAYALFGVAALSMGMTVAMTALEFLVAFLQAFVFTVLTCIYLNDVVNLGEGH